jgi:hypothetical protein
VEASHRYQRSAANSGTGVSDGASHTPSTFAAGAAFNARVDRFGPLASEFLQGFQNIGLQQRQSSRLQVERKGRQRRACHSRARDLAAVLDRTRRRAGLAAEALAARSFVRLLR